MVAPVTYSAMRLVISMEGLLVIRAGCNAGYNNVPGWADSV